MNVQSRLKDIGYVKEVLGSLVLTDELTPHCDGQMTDMQAD